MNDTQRTIRQMADTLQNTLGDGLSLASEFREIEKAMQAAYSAGAEQMRRDTLAILNTEPLGYRTMEEHEKLERFADTVIAKIRNLPVGESSRAPEGSK